MGDKQPIYLCSLLPERLETSALNLEFEEDEKMMESQPNMKIHMVEKEFKCFWYTVKILHWLASQWNAGKGWARIESVRRYIALSGKLVLYDLENHTIGWEQNNCLSSIKVKGEGGRNNYDVVAHGISFVSSPLRASAISVRVFVAVLLYEL